MTFQFLSSSLPPFIYLYIRKRGGGRKRGGRRKSKEEEGRERKGSRKSQIFSYGVSSRGGSHTWFIHSCGQYCAEHFSCVIHLKRTKIKQLYVWYCTNKLCIQLYVCLLLIYIYIYIYLYISYIKCNVVTLYERV